MKLKNLFTEDRAVSPVIGVILMVAITVILAAVIGTFVIGLGDDLGGTTPSASFDVSVSAGNDEVVFTHNGGDRIPANESRIVASSGIDSPDVDPSSTGQIVNESLTAGSTVTVTFTQPDDEETVRLVYDDGSRSSTLATATVEGTEN